MWWPRSSRRTSARRWVSDSRPAPETDPHSRGVLTAVEFDDYGAWIELDGQAWVNLAHVEQVTPFRTATQ